MRLHPIHVVVISLPLMGVVGACSSSSTSSGSVVIGPGGSESSATGTGSGSGGAGGTVDLDVDAATPDCSGDEGAWTQLTATPGACETSADCCVIVSPCLSEVQVVAASQADKASAVWPYCAVACTDCVAPAVDVACIAGACLGRRLPAAPPDSPLRLNHCGTTIELAAKTGATGVHFTCGG
jgi:hypothetical protein